jgi:hypothetical protein
VCFALQFLRRLVLTCPLFSSGLLGPMHAPYYTSNMNLADAAGLVSGFDEIVRRAIADDLKSPSTTFDKPEHASVVEYLETIEANVAKFTSTGGVVGRIRERDLIMKFFQKKGTMAFICGGPSVGKTKLLDDIIKVDTQMRNFKGGAGQSMPVRVVRFDGRAVDSLHKALQKEVQEKGVLPLGAVVEVDVGGVKVKMPLTGGSDVAAVIDCVTALWEQAQKDNAHVVVVLDEANSFLQTTNNAAGDTVKLFNTLVLHTKQTNHMSVVLMSSDEALPFRLEDIGLKTTHLSHILAVGGAAPQEMLDQLEELGVRKNLRELLVRIYGGHIWQVRCALDRLASEFKAGDKTSVLRGPMDSIKDAFALWEEKKGDRERLVGVLEEVARCGFYPLHKNDALSRVLTRSNACTFLTDGTKEFFVDPEVRLERSGVTASTQLVRVLIPVVLQQLKEY